MRMDFFKLPKAEKEAWFEACKARWAAKKPATR